MLNVAQNLYYGVSAASVLLLAAIGLAITFGVMGVINMAHGEMVMLGAYMTFVVQSALPPSAAALVAGLRHAAGLPRFRRSVGVAIERLVIRCLYARPLETLLATWGVSLMLQQGVRTLFGANNRQVRSRRVHVRRLRPWRACRSPTNRLWIIVLSARCSLASS